MKRQTRPSFIRRSVCRLLASEISPMLSFKLSACPPLVRPADRRIAVLGFGARGMAFVQQIDRRLYEQPSGFLGE